MAVNFTDDMSQVLMGAPIGVRTAYTQAATRTMTAAEIINSHIIWTGATAEACTTPTAVLLVAAIPNCQVGQTFLMFCTNAGSNTITMTAGSGCTLTGTATMATATGQVWRVRVTNVTSGAEAYTLDSVLKTAS